MTDRTGNNCHLKDNALLIVPKRRGHGCHRGSPGETVGVGVWGVVMRWKEGEDLRAKAFVMVSPEGKGEAASAGLELAILSDFLRLWGQGVVPLVWNLVLGTSCPEFESDTGGGGSVGSVFEKHVRDLNFLSREGRDLGVAFQAPSGSQASSRWEAKDSALLSSRDAGLLEPPERPGAPQDEAGLTRKFETSHVGGATCRTPPYNLCTSSHILEIISILFTIPNAM